MRKIISCLLISGVLVIGCASFGKFTPQGAATATAAVTTAQGLLHALDGFYNQLLALKLVPDYTTEATKALAIADQAAEQLKKIIAGATVSDAQLNVVAGQVSGAQAILATIGK